MSDADAGNKAGGAAALLRKPGVMVAAAVATVSVVAYLLISSGPAGIAPGTTYIAKRGNLDITVVVGGSVQALESQEIVSQIKGNQGVKILSLVDEGYLVTPEDVSTGKVLVELDSADLEDRVVNQEIAFQSAQASYVERKAQYDIQINQNQSLITAAELKAKFALMDFEKYLGKKAVDSIIERLGLDTTAAKLEAFKASSTIKPVAPPVPAVHIGVAPPVRSDNETSGGEARRDRVRADVTGEQPQEFPAAGGDGQRRGGGGERRRDSQSGGGQTGGPPGGGRMDPERFKAMIEANGGKIPEEIASRMRERGLDPDMILKQMGITPGEGGAAVVAPASEQPSAPIQSSAIFIKDEAYQQARAAIDFTQYANADELEDGEAKQQLRTFEDRILVAREDLRLAETSLEGKERLAERDFITQNELDLEKVKVQKAEIQVESSQTDLSLYVQYTFVKTAEMLLSDYEEALSALEREMQKASAELAQAEARLKSAEQQYNLESSQLIDLKDQLSKCVIRAERPGLVVYGSSTESNPFRRSNEEPIQEGTTVRERQKIITIPDMTKMGVKVSVHESAVQRVAPGQPVKIRVDAFADRALTGSVDRVAVLADSANMFMNPDLKVYPTTLKIEGVFEWLRPGMSAQVEILTGTLTDVVYVPIQAVTFHGADRVVYVVQGGKPVRRIVTTGSFTEDFIEIKSGIEAGEEVLLLAPDAGQQDQMNKDEKEAAPKEEAAASTPA